MTLILLAIFKAFRKKIGMDDAKSCFEFHNINTFITLTATKTTQ